MFRLFSHDVQELNTKTIIDNIDLKKLRMRAKILVVDDDPKCRIHENLRKYGYSNVALERDIARFSDISDYNLILCDINGVGENLSNGKQLKYKGLSVAEEIKKLYPLIKVISYSAEKATYEGNYIAERIVDDFFDKDEDPTSRNALIDNQIKSCFSPVDAWNNFRMTALVQGASIHEIAELETYFVKCVQKKQEFSTEKVKNNFKYYVRYLDTIKHLVAIVSIYLNSGN